MKPSRQIRVVVIVALAVIWLLLGNVLEDASSALSNSLLVMLYLLAPWTAINLMDYFFVRRGHYAITDLFTPNGIYGAWAWRGIVAFIIGVLVEIPFMVVGTTYTGFVAEQYLSFVDISWIVGMVVAGGLYFVFTRSLDLDAEAVAIDAQRAGAARHRRRPMTGPPRRRTATDDGGRLAAVTEAADRLLVAFSSHDRDGYFACFAPDATFLFHTSPRAAHQPVVVRAGVGDVGGGRLPRRRVRHERPAYRPRGSTTSRSSRTACGPASRECPRCSANARASSSGVRRTARGSRCTSTSRPTRRRTHDDRRTRRRRGRHRWVRRTPPRSRASSGRTRSRGCPGSTRSSTPGSRSSASRSTPGSPTVRARGSARRGSAPARSCCGPTTRRST